MTTDPRYLIHDQEFEPTVVDLAREQQSIKNKSRFTDTRREYRTEDEQDVYLQETIEKAERRLITLRYLQAIRAAQKTDKGWLRKTLDGVLGR